MNTLHHHRSLAWALFHAHSLPRLVFPMGMLTHLQLDCPVNIQKPRLPHCKMLVHLYFGSFNLVKITFAFFLLLLISRCIYESSIIYSPGSPYHKLPSNHLQFHKCSVLMSQLSWVSAAQVNKKSRETTYVDILISKLCKAIIHHSISCTSKSWPQQQFVVRLQLILRQQCRRSSLTDFSNYLFVYFAVEVVPTIPTNFFRKQ